jgi:threonine/homoserine/homoserine lactone efflux protein
MTIETGIAFALSAFAMLALPGPTILLVMGRSLGSGRRNALPLVAGVALGDLSAMVLSLAGLGALLATSATAFALLGWVGATYLVWLGVWRWRAAVAAGAVPPPSAPRA